MLTPNVTLCSSVGPCSGHFWYESRDNSFTFEYRNAVSLDYENVVLIRNHAWLRFGVIEVAVSCNNGQLHGVSGYTGPRTWTDSSLMPVCPILSSSLTFEDFDQCQIGVGYTMECAGLESVKYNSKSGWAHIGDGTAAFDSLVEFATNCCAAIHGRRIVAIWLHPENWRDLSGLHALNRR